MILENDLGFVSFDELSFHLLGALLSSKFTLLLTLKIFFSLTFNEFSLEHFFLESLNVVQFEFFELVRNSFSVRDLVFVFNLKLSLHFLVVLSHLVLLHLTPVGVDFFLNLSLSVLQSLLSFLLVVDITHHHLRLKRLDLVLGFVHVLVSLSKLTIVNFILVVSLFGIDAASFDLYTTNKHEIAVNKNYP